MYTHVLAADPRAGLDPPTQLLEGRTSPGQSEVAPVFRRVGYLVLVGSDWMVDDAVGLPAWRGRRPRTRRGCVQTLDRYTHLFANRDDEITVGLDSMYRAAQATAGTTPAAPAQVVALR